MTAGNIEWKAFVMKGVPGGSFRAAVLGFDKI